MKDSPVTTGSTAFDYPNFQDPKPIGPIYYGNQYIPHPNDRAKMVSSEEILRQVMDAE